jgi:hypothetical protein
VDSSYVLGVYEPQWRTSCQTPGATCYATQVGQVIWLLQDRFDAAGSSRGRIEANEACAEEKSNARPLAPNERTQLKAVERRVDAKLREDHVHVVGLEVIQRRRRGRDGYDSVPVLLENGRQHAPDG